MDQHEAEIRPTHRMSASVTTVTESTKEAAPRTARPTTAEWAAIGVASLVILVLLGLWPYQHWHYETRSSVLHGLWKLVMLDSEWIFCLVVPPITGFLIYRMRGQLRHLPLHGAWLGAPVLTLGLAFFWIGYKADTAYPGFMAAQTISLGLILLLGGWTWLRRLFFPWIFLSFMWPLLPLEGKVAFPLRMMTAGISAHFLNLIGVDVVREGTAIYSAADPAQGLILGDMFRLDVDEPCSGIRSLYALLMISALYGYMALKGVWPRLALFFSAIPLAVAGNFVRMVMLGIGSKHFGTEFAVGRNIDGHQEMSLFHELAGYAVFAVALAGMFAVSTLLDKVHTRWSIKKRAGASSATPATSPAPLPAADARRTLIQAGVALGLAAAGLAVCAATDTSYRVGPPGVKMKLPARLGDYVSDERAMTSQEKGILQEDVQIERRLYMTPQRAILATIVLSGAMKRSLHPPEICLPGQGWTISSRNKTLVDLGNGRHTQATIIQMFRDSEPVPGKRLRTRAFNLFWYEGSDGTSSAGYDEHVQKSYLDAVFRNINHRWALMSFFVPLREQPIGLEDPFAELNALEDTRAFIQQLGPEILMPQEAQ